jgi:hypothetical protein
MPNKDYQLAIVDNRSAAGSSSNGVGPAASEKQSDTFPVTTAIIAGCGVGVVAVGAIVFAFQLTGTGSGNAAGAQF